MLAKFQAFHLLGTPAAFIGRDFFLNVHGIRADLVSRMSGRDPVIEGVLRSLASVLGRRRDHLVFPLTGDAGLEHEFSAPTARAAAEEAPGGALALTTGQQTIFNRRGLPGGDGPHVLIRPYEHVSNHLVFMHSQLGQHYYAYTDRYRISVYQLEADPLNPGRTMAGLGRHLLFRVVRPSAPVRLVLDVTTSYTGDGTHRLPPASALGAERVPLPLVGRGSARVFSAPMTPREIAGRPYVAIDMGVEGRPFPLRRTGLMRLYGTDVPLDPRRLVVSGRDASLVSDEEYTALEPPTRLARFPADLGNPSLEYSGLWEDGWIAEEAYVHLGRPQRSATLVVRGMAPPVPLGAEPPEMRILVDGLEVARRPITGADFTLRIAVPPGPRRARVDLQLSRLRPLPAPDRRTAGVRLLAIAFED